MVGDLRLTKKLASEEISACKTVYDPRNITKCYKRTSSDHHINKHESSYPYRRKQNSRKFVKTNMHHVRYIARCSKHISNELDA